MKICAFWGFSTVSLGGRAYPSGPFPFSMSLVKQLRYVVGPLANLVKDGFM